MKRLLEFVGQLVVTGGAATLLALAVAVLSGSDAAASVAFWSVFGVANVVALLDNTFG